MRTAKFLSVLVLLMVITIQSKSDLVVNLDSGQGTNLGNVSVTATWDPTTMGYGNYDPYILGGLNVNCTLNAANGEMLLQDDSTPLRTYDHVNAFEQLQSVNDSYWIISFFPDYNQSVSAFLIWYL